MPYIFIFLVCLNVLYLGVTHMYQTDTSTQKLEDKMHVEDENKQTDN